MNGMFTYTNRGMIILVLISVIFTACSSSTEAMTVATATDTDTVPTVTLVPTDSPTPTDNPTPTQSPTPEPTSTPTDVPTPLPSSTPTQEPMTSPDFTNLVVMLQDLPPGFEVVDSGEYFFAPGEMIPLINQEVDRAFSYMERENGLVISGGVFLLDDHQERALCDAMMSFAVEGWVTAIAQGSEDIELELIDVKDLADVANGNRIVLNESEVLRSVEALMFRRGVIGAFIQILSIDEASPFPIEEVASILDNRIQEGVPYEGWMTQDMASSSYAQLILREVQKGDDSCRYLFNSEGFMPNETLNFRLTDPNGNVYIDTSQIGLPIGINDTFSFVLGSQDQSGLWIVEFIGTGQSAAYIFQWAGQCPEQ